MGSGLSVTKVEVEDDKIPGERYMLISFNDITYNRIIKFSEEVNSFDDDSKKEINPRFCLLDDMDVSQCGSFLSDKLAKKYAMVTGEECTSFKFRPGSIVHLDEKDDVPYPALSYLSKGTRCKFVRNDYFITDEEKYKCCTNPDIDDCPERLKNYDGTYCDDVLSVYCLKNPNSPRCIYWMRSKNKSALTTYQGLCSEHMDERYCSEFARVTRPEYYSFSDNALENFCNTHTGNRNCWCVNPPREYNEERYLGPRVCWLHECTDESRDRKWLFFDQDVQRTRCQYVGCNINVDSLTLQNSDVSLIADCSRGYSLTGDLDPGKPKPRRIVSNTRFHLASIPLIVSALAVIFYFVIIYARRRVNSKEINVRRKK